MGCADVPYEVLGWQGDALRLRVTQQTEARRLLWSLLGSKGTAHRVLMRRQLLRDEVSLWPASPVGPGEVLTLRLHRPEERGTTSDEPVELVYQDEALLVADKPAGLLVHSDGSGDETLTARVQGLLRRQGSPAVAQAVQRLDVATTGLTLFSLTEEFQPKLDAQVAGREMRKRYLAVVQGRLAGAERGWLSLDGPIARDRHDARRMRVGESGKPSLTKVRTLQQSEGLSLLLVELGSGRRHQIRVHLAHAGHPILGDRLYGGASHGDGLMLHAWQEDLVHPVTGERLHFRTAWPARFGRLFAQE